MPKKRKLNEREEMLEELAGGFTAEDHACRRIAEIRERLDMTRADLAAGVNAHLPLTKQIPYQAVREIETGRRRLKLDELFAFAAALSVAPVYLVTPIREGEGWFRVGQSSIRPVFARDWIEGRKLPASFGGRDDELQRRFYIEEAPEAVLEGRRQRASERLKDPRRPTPRTDGGVLFLVYQKQKEKLDAEHQQLLETSEEEGTDG